MKLGQAFTLTFAAIMATASACEDDRITYTNKCKVCGYASAGNTVGAGTVGSGGVKVSKNGEELDLQGPTSDYSVLSGEPVSGDYGLHCNIVFYGDADFAPGLFKGCKASYGKLKEKEGEVTEEDQYYFPIGAGQYSECCVDFDC
ncbi:hypothetical protein PHISCL_03188 [Aspergillus sclerotialis]|uniref:Uncharacterized protein n=1 Tax=Aspergillus sclerotialis TaxID=2070753 RepID=A0A3A2ZN91_9EURO|nr:hypothetical protein PHISCL_03188 [Aspergillus sclerotialis]